MEPREINSVDRLIGEMEAIAPIPFDPGYISSIQIINQNIWLIVKELKALIKKAEKRKLIPVEPDEDEIQEIMPRRQRKSLTK